MDKVKVQYTGGRSAPMKYLIRPGGKLFTPQGYIFGSSSSTNLLLPEEAAVLADLDGDSGITTIKRGRESKLKNRDLVTVGFDSSLPDSDTFSVDVAPKPKKAAPATKKGDNQ